MGETTTQTAPSTGTFHVSGKHIYRASIVGQVMGTQADGSPIIVQQSGPTERLEVGTELTDVTEAELKAFGDRLAPMDDTAKKSLAKAKGVPEDAPPDAVLPPAGAPSSPADTPKPLDVVQEAPEVVAAKAEATRRQGAAPPPPPAPAPAPSETAQHRRSGG